MVAPTYKPSTQDAQAREYGVWGQLGLHWVPGQPGLQSKEEEVLYSFSVNNWFDWLSCKFLTLKIIFAVVINDAVNIHTGICGHVSISSFVDP